MGLDVNIGEVLLGKGFRMVDFSLMGLLKVRIQNLEFGQFRNDSKPTF